MGVLDKLLVVISANTREFNAAMDGVEARTMKSQSVLGQMSAAGASAGANLAKGFAGATVAAAGFALAVRKLDPILSTFGSLVNEGVVGTFKQMNTAMERAGRTLAITLATAMSKASGGFVQLITKITDTITSSSTLDKLFTGLGYVFSALATSVGKVVTLFSALGKAFQILSIAAEIANNKLTAFFGGIPESRQETLDLTDAMLALQSAMLTDLSNAFDPSEYIANIEQAQAMTKEIFATPIDTSPPTPPSWMKVYQEGLRALITETSNAFTGMSKIRNDAHLMDYEIELRKRQLDKEGVALEIEGIVQVATKRQELANLRRSLMLSAANEESEVRTRHDAMWDSSLDYRLNYTSQVFSKMAILMETKSKKMFRIGQAMAIASALIDTFAGMNKALAQGGFWGIAMAAAVGVVGFANVAKIASTKMGGGSGGGGSTASQPALPSEGGREAPAAGPQQTNVNVTLIGESFGQGAVRGLISQINGATDDNMRLNISGGR